MKYADIPAASEAATRDFLVKYDRFELQAKRLGLVPIPPEEALAERSVSFLRVAIDLFNTSSLQFRAELFTVTAVIAWTYVLHAYYRQQGIPYHYEHDGVPVLIDGQQKLFDLSACLAHPKCPLAAGEKNNLRYILALRNEVEHRAAYDIASFIQAKAQACALNFVRFCTKHFGQAFSPADELSFALQLAKLSVQNNPELAGAELPASIQAVNALVEQGLTPEEYNDPSYAYRVYLTPKTVNNPKAADEAVTFATPDSAIGLAIKQVEKPKYRQKDVIALMRDEGFENYSSHRFQKFWKSIDAKNPKKGLAVQLGEQWFWYEEMLKLVRASLAAEAKPPAPA